MDAIPSLRRVVRARWIIFALASVVSAAGSDASSGARHQNSAELVELARQHEESDLARAWDYAEQARVAAQTPREQLAADLRRGVIQRRRGDYTEALATTRAGLERATALGEDVLQTEFLQLMGHVEWSVSNFPAALESYTRCATRAEQAGRLELAARAHSGLATTYRDLDDLELARRHYEAALGHAEKTENRQLLAAVLNNFGNYRADIGDHAASVALHRRALALREAANNRSGMADSFFNLGTAAANTGDLAAAVDYYQRAQQLYETLGFARNLANLHHSFASVLRRLDRTDEGLEHLRLAGQLAEKLKTSQLSANIQRELAATQAARGDYQAAFAAQQQFIAAHDAMLGEKTRRQVAALNVRYETERRQHEIAMLRRDQDAKEAELARARLQRYGLIVVLGLGIVAVGALVSRQRMKLATERRVHDETRAAKEIAERADAFKTRLVGVASHDLKAPVAALIGGAELLEREAADPAAVTTMARLMVGEGRRLLTMIRDLLDLAALEKGRLELKRRDLEIAALVREGIEAVEVVSRAKQQELTCRVEPGAENARVLGDPARLRQVFDNLLDNAIKFTPTGKAVLVSISSASGAVRVAVQDSGPGLSSEDYLRVFQPFERLSARPTGGESSTGLGLSIARELIALHGGQIIVDSVPGQGATFSFELPLATA